MKTILYGLMFGAVAIITMVVVGSIPIAMPRRAEVSAAPPTVAIDNPQVRQQSEQAATGTTPVSINEGYVKGRIMQLDRDKKQILVQSPTQKMIMLVIQNDTNIRFRGRNGTFGDLEVSQPVIATYMNVGGKNLCRQLTIGY